MFLDVQQSEEALDELLEIEPKDRELLKKWAEEWLVKKALENPGPWVEIFRPDLLSLVKDLKVKMSKGKPTVVPSSRDRSTLVLLIRGSRWFDGEPALEADLIGVLMPQSL